MIEGRFSYGGGLPTREIRLQVGRKYLYPEGMCFYVGWIRFCSGGMCFYVGWISFYSGGMCFSAGRMCFHTYETGFYAKVVCFYDRGGVFLC